MAVRNGTSEMCSTPPNGSSISMMRKIALETESAHASNTAWTVRLFGANMQAAADKIAKTGVVDMLDGGPKASPKPSLASGVPAIFVTQVPTELIVFKGQPDFVPIVGTQLLWASNTTSDVIIDTTNNSYYALLAGRWFRGPGLTGPCLRRCANSSPNDWIAMTMPQSFVAATRATTWSSRRRRRRRCTIARWRVR